jgi:uncharacterized protein (DUF58 family)
LKIADRKHDVIVIRIVDPREQDLPNVGILEVRDAETGEVAYIDTSLPAVRDTYRANWEKNRAKLSKLFKSQRMDQIVIDTSMPYDAPLVRFFNERARRAR